MTLLKQLIEDRNRQTAGAVRKQLARKASDEQLLQKMTEAAQRMFDATNDDERRQAEKELKTLVVISARRNGK